jgi:hypothetical protein
MSGTGFRFLKQPDAENEMKSKKHAKPWTPADMKVMRAKAREGQSARLAAKALGRTPGAVKYKAMVEGVRFHAINQPQGPQKRLARRRRKFGMRATLRAAA